MTNNKITPSNVTFKDLKLDFGRDGGGSSGTMYFGKIKVVDFYDDGRSMAYDTLYFHDKGLEKAMLDYQIEHETDKYFHNTESFIERAIDENEKLKAIEKAGKENIKQFMQSQNLTNKLTVGAYIFNVSDGYFISLGNGLPEDLTETQAHELAKEKTKTNSKFEISSSVYFIKYTSARKVMLIKIK